MYERLNDLVLYSCYDLEAGIGNRGPIFRNLVGQSIESKKENSIYLVNNK